MPVKQKPTQKKYSRRFLKVYAPYLPLLLIVGLGIFISLSGSFKKKSHDEVLSYATNITPTTLLQETNKERTDNQAPILKINTNLNSAAQAKANDMAEKNYWSHVSPDGKEPSYFVEQSGYQYTKIAENLAYGFTSTKSAVSGWMNSPTHRSNLLDHTLSEVGFGIVNVENYQNQGPETIIVAIYGSPAESLKVVASHTTTTSNQNKISHIQTLTDGHAPWSSFVLGILIGGIVVYLVVTHTTRVRRVLKISERFIIKHPLLDMTLLALLALVSILIQTDGTIY